MTSKALPNSFHPARRLLAYSLKRTSGLTVLMTVVALLACLKSSEFMKTRLRLII